MDPFWDGVLARITEQRPDELDPILHRTKQPQVRGRTLGVTGAPAPAAELWQREDEGRSYIGVRITEPLADPALAALRLASAAIERRVVPIILSHLDVCGFESFGFRVERLPAGGEADAAAAEVQLKRFWNLAIVIDGRDIGLLS